MLVGVILLSLGALFVLGELNSGAFYMLAVAIACFAGGAVSMAGLGLTPTLSIFGVIAFLALPLAHWLRLRLRNPEADRLTYGGDIGHIVTVSSITSSGPRVIYRGTVWQAQLSDTVGDLPVKAGDALRITERRGNTLILEPVPTTTPSVSD